MVTGLLRANSLLSLKTGKRSRKVESCEGKGER